MYMYMHPLVSVFCCDKWVIVVHVLSSAQATFPITKKCNSCFSCVQERGFNLGMVKAINLSWNVSLEN